MYVEDFYLRQSPSEQEQDLLTNAVSCAELSDRDTYIAELSEAGFVDVEFVDVTAEWASFVDARFRHFESHRAEMDRKYTVASAEKIHAFYAAVDTLFHSPALGGVIYTCRRPL